MAFARRQTSSTDEFLNLIANPFQSQLQAKAIYASLVWSFLVAGVLFLTFCLLRPRVPTVYAPRAKYADERHAPPPLGSSLLAWTASLRVREDDLADKIGLDAVVFLRFLRMLRNIFLVLTLIGLIILVPVNVAGGHQEYSQWPDVATLMKITPQYIHGGTKFWAFTLCAYIFQGTVCGFVWWNYRAVLRLKRAYFASQEYRASLHARTILLTHLPQHARTDQGIAQLVEGVVPIPEVPTTTVGRNVKDLPDLIEQHEEAVYKLEEHLAKYLKDPNRLPPARPTCKVAKRDRARYGEAPVDAINYLTERITTLTEEIREVRESIDRRNPMPYGFASYTHIEDAHAVAYAARKKGPEGSDVNLAPKPHDILWQNLGMTRKTRRTRVLMDGFWMVILTILFIVPNILTAVFLSDFSHLGLVWPAFNANLQAHSTAWGVAQGIIAPLVQILMYLALPPIFRRLYTHSGDVSKTMRDRHVTVRLYAFFVFNNLIVFSVFGSAWKFVASVVKAKNTGVWHAIEDSHPFVNLVIGLCNMSTFWFTWQMQRNLLAAADLLQAWPLIWGSFRRKYTSPTPRELIKFTAPQPFDYAGYYNNFLFVATVGLCYATLQPLILPITAFYMVIEVWWKKYMLQYICITKIESGGVSWKLLVNRLLFATLLANAVIALVVGANGIGSIQSIDTIQNGGMLYMMIPLPFLLWGFKWYTVRTFDEKIQYFSTRPYARSESGPSTLPGTPPPKPRSSERVALRFGHPGLYKPLITPMINSKAQHLLPELYRGPLSPPGPASPSTTLASPYTDSFPLSPMDPANRGKAAPHGTHPYPSYEQQQQRERELDSKHAPPNRPPLLPSLSYEPVHSPAMSFDNFKHRPEFRDDYGGDGELYGRPDDWVAPPYSSSDGKSFGAGSGHYARSASPHSSVGSSAPGSPRVGAAPRGYRAGSQSPGRSPRRRPVGGDEEETVYAQGYHRPSAVAGMAADSQEDLRAPLAGRAAGMGRSEPVRGGFGFGDSSYEELRTGRRR